MLDLRERVVDRFRENRDPGRCRCEMTIEDDSLQVDASDCPEGGRLVPSPDCRRAVVSTLERQTVDAVHVRSGGLERTYDGAAGRLLVAAGAFVDRIRDHDSRLAALAREDPLAAAREASGRTDLVADAATSTDFAELAADFADYESALSSVLGLQISNWRVETSPPPKGSLSAVRELDTGGTVREYSRPEKRDRYVLTPLEHTGAKSHSAVVTDAYERLARGDGGQGTRAPTRAVTAVAADDAPVETLARILRKHTIGYGLLEDLFADPNVSDVFVTAPAANGRIRVRVGETTMPTNVSLREDGVRALASRFRRQSGKAFSTADPTLDTSVSISDRQIRVAAVGEPVSDGVGFVFRAHDRTAWTLPKLVANGTLTARAAALLSLAVERGRSILIAGPRGAGKTTLLAALLWEVPPAVRTVVIEDAPELPVGQLRDHGRDVQALRVSEETSLSPAEALRTALRLGNGALAVGEVRGEEASVLYEAMRVGANSEAVLGTIHGDGAASVCERVVSDLDVPASSFAATDIVVSLELSPNGSKTRRVRSLETVVDAEAGTFETLFERSGPDLSPTGRIDRGNSRLVADLAEPTETYESVRTALSSRRKRLESLADGDRTGPQARTRAQLERA